MKMNICPFKGIHYDEKKVKNWEEVLCPLYDLVKNDDVKRFKKMSEYNFIYLTKRKPFVAEEYKRARRLFDSWLDQSILVQDREDCFYFYKIEYSLEGAKNTLYGFIGQVSLNHTHKIYDHERTYYSPRTDRFRLLRAVKANLSPVYLLSLKKEKLIRDLFRQSVKSLSPLIVTRDHLGCRHFLYKVPAQSLDSRARSILLKLNSSPLLIADGHHRFSAARQYRKYLVSRQKSLPAEHPANFMMCFLSDMYQEGVALKTFYRIIKLNSSIKAMEEKLSPYFNISYFNKPESLRKFVENNSSSTCFGLVTKNTRLGCQLTNGSLVKEISRDKEGADRINVVFLHRFVLGRILKLNLGEETVEYTPSWKDFMLSSKRHTGFIPQSARKEEVLDIIKKGILFPHKSTYFFPKLLSGLVIRSLR